MIKVLFDTSVLVASILVIDHVSKGIKLSVDRERRTVGSYYAFRLIWKKLEKSFLLYYNLYLRLS